MEGKMVEPAAVTDRTSAGHPAEASGKVTSARPDEVRTETVAVAGTEDEVIPCSAAGAPPGR
jgi:hypothetical protein